MDIYDGSPFVCTPSWYEYHKWMVSEVMPEFRVANIYSDMLNALDTTMYIPHLTDDMNRVKDAIYMRQEWCHENKVFFDIPDSDIFGGYCSVLEVLVAFAKRIDKEWLGHGGEDRPDLIFSVFMDNLWMTHYTNDTLRDPVLFSQMYRRINRFVQNDIDDQGVGGLFPLYNRQESQKEKSLWSQMMPWLQENSNNW